MDFDKRKTVGSIVVASAALISAIAGYEGFVPHTYEDTVGVKTIGFGHTGPDVKDGQKITKAQAYELLVKDINKHWDSIKKSIRVPLHQYEAEAYTSFSYNVGAGNFRSSTLLKKLNLKDYAGACKQLLKWTRAGGKVLPGLVKRRQDEYQMCIGKSDAKAAAIVGKYQSGS